MNRKRIFALAFAVLMVLALAACGMKNNDKMGDMSGNGSAMTGEPKNAEEALALHKELLERENAILSENTELWEKVFMAADKGMTMQEDGKNYGDFLLDTVEAAKEQFTDKEYEWLKESATEISNIENRLTELEEKYPEIMQKSMDGDMSMPAGSDTSNPPDDGSMQKFPAFEGKDLDGNTVKSDELFSANAVTVVNFWFTTCNPCVGELSELECAESRNWRKKGGGPSSASTPSRWTATRRPSPRRRMCCAKKGATYQNVYFDSDGEAGKFDHQHLCLSHHLCGRPQRQYRGRTHRRCHHGKEAGGDAAKAHRPGSCRRYGLTRDLKSACCAPLHCPRRARGGVSPDSPERRKRDVSKRIGPAFRRSAAAGRLRRRAADCAEGKERTGNKHGRSGF